MNSGVSTKVSTTSNQFIQNLKDALDRATEIVCSTTPSKTSNSKRDLNNIQECKTVFEDLYGTQYDNQEIKVIEKSFSNESFLGVDEVKNVKVNEAVTRHEQIFNQAFINNETVSSTITKTSIESETSEQIQQSVKLRETDRNKTPFTRITSTPQKIRVDEGDYVNVRTMNTVIMKDSPRRRSLPARLNNLSVTHTPRTILNKKVSNKDNFEFYIVKS